jgi:hypothetical protein
MENRSAWAVAQNILPFYDFVTNHLYCGQMVLIHFLPSLVDQIITQCIMGEGIRLLFLNILNEQNG